MSKLVVQCPSCSGELTASRLSCKSCSVLLEGQFELPALLRLPADDVAWIGTFVRSSGSLKEMASREGVSYPTVRNRLDDIIRKLDEVESVVERRRHDILDALEKGTLSAKDAADKLRKVGL